MSTTIYRCGGTSVDWVYEKAKVKYSFTAELRDRGSFGFLLPRNQIIPTAQETWEGIKTIANEAKV
jgi:carboxypeptidase A4